jgi:hypothetical protein
MSLPLSRRIVQAALVVAAGAVPVVAAGAAAAAPAVPNLPDLGGFNQAGGLTGANAAGTVAGAVPTVSNVTGAAASKALPAATRVLSEAAGQLTQATGSTTSATGTLGGATGATRSMPLGMAPQSAESPVQANLAPASPTSSSPLSALPLNTLPLSAAQGALGHLTEAAGPAAAPAQRLGGLPGLGDAGGLGSVTQALPLGGGLPIG